MSYNPDYAAGCMVIENVMALFYGEDKPYTEKEIKEHLKTSIQIKNYNLFVSLQKTIIVTINIYRTQRRFLNYIIFIQVLLRDKIKIMESKTNIEEWPFGLCFFPFNSYIEDLVSVFADLVVYEHFLKALREVYNLKQLDDFIKDISLFNEGRIEDFKELSTILEGGISIRALQDGEPLIEVKKPMYKRDYNRLLKIVSDPENFNKSYYMLVIGLDKKVNIRTVYGGYNE